MQEKTRIIALDVLRGFAILGIPLMNVQSFSMVGQAYLNPNAFGDLKGLNLITWVSSHILADQKFMTLFSLLFGASVLLITSKYEQKGRSSFKIHYKRNFWLLIIGLLHAYLVWYGDILAPYAFCAFLVYPFRKQSIKGLIALGLVVFSVSSLLDFYTGFQLLNAPKEVIQSISGGWAPNADLIQQEVAAYQGSISNQMAQRYHTAQMLQTTYFVGHIFWRVFGLMLLGMALFKSGFLTGKSSKSVYIKSVLFVGFPSLIIVAFGVIFNFHHDWKLQYSMFLGSQFNYWGSLGMAIGYIGIMMLVIQKQCAKGLLSRIAAIGRMALSNYLVQSLIMALFFYGLGFFGKVERSQQLIMVAFIWVVQLSYSKYWLSHFHYGPFEWLWRSLSRGKIEVFRKK